VVFQDYSPLSQNAELLRRMLSPLADQAVEQALARTRKALAAQSIDLSAERFVVYVPPQAPPGGYGLMVFISPGSEAKLPAGWAPILDQYGIIFVSAARSGNEADVLGRRAPLALLALENIRRRYQVDPDRTYIGGYSGGARVALRMALSYPDVFRGAFLNAGADPIGAPPDHLPNKALFARFQTVSRIVYVTGAADGETLYRDADSLQSMRQHCAFGAEAQITPATDHELAKPAALAKALASLRAQMTSNPGRQAACERTLEDDMTRGLDHIEALIKAGKSSEAKSLLLRLDGQYGGLARDRIVGLAEACGCGVVSSSDGK
jgi:dienelactone hydrolase